MTCGEAPRPIQAIRLRRILSRLPANPYPGGYSVNTGVTNRGLWRFHVHKHHRHLRYRQPAWGTAGRMGCTRTAVPARFHRQSLPILHGNHAFKFGYEQVFVHFNDSSTANTNGTVTFASLENFLTGTADSRPEASSLATIPIN